MNPNNVFAGEFKNDLPNGKGYIYNAKKERQYYNTYVNGVAKGEKVTTEEEELFKKVEEERRKIEEEERKKREEEEAALLAELKRLEEEEAKRIAEEKGLEDERKKVEEARITEELRKIKRIS